MALQGGVDITGREMVLLRLTHDHTSRTMKTAQALLVGSALALAAAPCWAAGSTHLGTFNDWNAYLFSDKTGKVCYIASLPTSQKEAPAKRRSTFLSVTHRPGDKSFDVVSVEGGFAYKADSTVTMEIDGTKVELFTKGGGAWARDPDTDKSLVAALKKGRVAIVTGHPAKGKAVVDDYSLSGFSAAYAKIGEACGAK